MRPKHAVLHIWADMIDDRVALTKASADLMKAVYPKVAWDIKVGSPSKDKDVNILEVFYSLNTTTQHRLEGALQLIFGEKFEVSFHGDDFELNRRAEIEEVVRSSI